MSSLSLFDEIVPEYVRPSMKDAIPPQGNGRKAIGSFSGCGGSTLGLKMAGWDVLAGIEFIPAAAETYRANFPNARMYEEDIRKLDPARILLDLGLAKGELDLFEGSPPCASFSAAGMGERGWGTVKKYSDSEQRTDDLFWEWARLLEGFSPKAFVAENVPGMISGASLEEYAHKITRDLGKLGYRVTAKVLNAANFGVPQERRRLIFYGLRVDLARHPELPRETVSVPHTLEQALASVDPEDPDHKDFLEASSMEGKAVGRTWEAKKGLRSKDDCARCGKPLGEHGRQTKTVGSVKKTKAEAGATRTKQIVICADGEPGVEIKDYFLLVVPDLKKPCTTVTATGAQTGAASVVHPTECRKFTPAEVKAISGFPADFVLTGTREQRYERIGRTVTPPMYKAVGERIAHQLKSAESWRCACGRGGPRYDGGDVCERCVMDDFAEHG